MQVYEEIYCHIFMREYLMHYSFIDRGLNSGMFNKEVFAAFFFFMEGESIAIVKYSLQWIAAPGL